MHYWRSSFQKREQMSVSLDRSFCICLVFGWNREEGRMWTDKIEEYFSMEDGKYTDAVVENIDL